MSTNPSSALRAGLHVSSPQYYPDPVLLSFTNAVASVRERPGLKSVIKRYFRDYFGISQYIITIPNEDQISYSYFLHDLPDKDPADEGFRVITGTAMPIQGSMTGAVLQADKPAIFNLREIVSKHKLSFPSASFWAKVGADSITGIRLRLGSEDVGILWIQTGYSNHGVLGFICSQLAIAISNIISREKVEDRHLQAQMASKNNHNEIIGSGTEMQKVFSLVNQVAPANSTVLILGETGVGKELIARALHNASPRHDKIMVKVNCAALPENLIESELFGHERGSFTGAIERRIGKFELANNGTLFLDEIGEMPLSLQTKLLRAIQEREIERVGGKNPIYVNVRIIAATNRDLLMEVYEGRFRRDLYYRLNVFPITIPALRNRKEDIPMLANHFMQRFSRSVGKKFTSIAPKPLADLQGYNWPGNIRELEHAIERSIILSTGPVLKEIHLNTMNLDRLYPQKQEEEQTIRTLKENERDHILRTLVRLKGKISGHGGAAQQLDVPPSTLNSKINKLGITKEEIMHG